MSLCLTDCSPPRSGSGGVDGVSTLAIQAYAGARSDHEAVDIDSDRADGDAPAAPVLVSTRRDDRTLRAATPYEDRHGRAGCLHDCVQHEAGYKWAALHTLTDASHCAGATAGFIDGCRAYALDHRPITASATPGGKG